MKNVLNFIFVSILMIIVIACYIYIRHTPTYSLWQVKKSISGHDWEHFNKYVDIDSLVNSFSNDIAEASCKEMSKSKEIPEPFSITMRSFLASQIDTDSREEIRSLVLDVKTARNSKRFFKYMLGDTDFNKYKLKSVIKHSDEATVNVLLPNNRIMEIGMQKEGNLWRVENISNAKDLYAEALAK